MIRVTLEPTQVTVYQINSLAIRLTNTGHKPCTHVVLRLKLPTHIVLLEGSDRIEAEQIYANQSVTHMIRIRPRQIGTWALTTTNFSYRDAQDQPQYPDPLHLEVTVVPAMPKQEISESKLAVGSAPRNQQMLSEKALQATHETDTINDLVRCLKKELTDHFNGEELRDLFFEMGIDYDGLRGESPKDKGRELVLYCMRHKRIGELKETIKRLRPNIVLP